VGVVHNRNAALAQVEDLQPEVLVVDLMLPGLRSIDLVRQVAGSHSRVRILTAAPDHPPHDCADRPEPDRSPGPGTSGP
jgi:DNA-binding NarL/FixJ family response regulator